MNLNKIREKLALGKRRLIIGWILGIVIIISATHLPSWFAILIFLAGCALRIWASGYIKKNNVLSIDGPYRYTRNPLYVGSFLMLLGATISILPWWLTLIFALVFLASYYDKIMLEEGELLALFGEAYLDYQQTVPRFFPQPWRFFSLHTQLPDSQNFSWPQAIKNRAYEGLGVFIIFYLGVAILLYLKQLMHL